MTHSEILEIGKLMSDLFALVTTFDTGMVGLIVAIVEKVFTPERVFIFKWNKILFVTSIFFPILSLLFSILALISIPYNVSVLLQGGASRELVNPISFYSSFFCFFFGILSFVILSLKVFFGPVANSDKEVQSRKQQRGSKSR